MYQYNEPLTVESVELRALRADEVIVKLAASGVCHSDLSALQGKMGCHLRPCSGTKVLASSRRSGAG